MANPEGAGVFDVRRNPYTVRTEYGRVDALFDPGVATATATKTVSQYHFLFGDKVILGSCK